MKILSTLVIFSLIFIFNGCSNDTKNDGDTDITVDGDSDVTIDADPDPDAVVDGDSDVTIDTDPDPDAVIDGDSDVTIDADPDPDVVIDGDTDEDIETDGDTPVECNFIENTKTGVIFQAKTQSSAKWDLYLLNLSDYSVQAVTSTADKSETYPQWVKNGTQLMYAVSANTYKVTYPAMEAVSDFKGYDPVADDNGDNILVKRYVEDTQNQGVYDEELFLYRSQSNDYVRLTNFNDAEIYNQPISYDIDPLNSKRFVVAMLNPDTAIELYSSDLYLYTVDASDNVSASNLSKQASTVYAKVANRAPAWSSDGSFIVYFNVYNGGNFLKTINPQSGDSAYLATSNIGAVADAYVISPSNDYVFSIENGGEEFKIIRISDGAECVSKGVSDLGLNKIASPDWR